MSEMLESQGKTRREEIIEIAGKGNDENLSFEDKLAYGLWLQRRFDVLSAKVPDSSHGITPDDVVEAYASAKWNDKSKFLWNDMRMLKSVAAHFDQLAVAGPSPNVIDREDVDALIGGARVKRTSTEVTSDYPDGRLFRRTARGEVLNRAADGSLSYDNGAIALQMNNADGKGSLEIKSPIENSFGGIFSQLEPSKIALERHRDGTWWGKDKDGQELQMALDDHSVRLTMSDMDMLLTTKGGFLRDPSDPAFTIFINADGTMTVVDEGKTADMATSEQGVTLVQENDGTKYFVYPFDLNLKVAPDKSMVLSGAGVIPRMSVSATGDIAVHRKDIDNPDAPDLEAKANANGEATITLEDGRQIARNKDGVLRVTANHAVFGQLEVLIEPNGKYVFSGENLGNLTLTPPTIRRPK